MPICLPTGLTEDDLERIQQFVNLPPRKRNPAMLPPDWPKNDGEM